MNTVQKKYVIFSFSTQSCLQTATGEIKTFETHAAALRFLQEEYPRSTTKKGRLYDAPFKILISRGSKR